MEFDEMWEMIQKMERQKMLRSDFNDEETMKLLCCSKCSDVISLTTKEERSCSCGACSGVYTDSLNAVFKGEHCIPLGIDNNKFIKAIKMAQIENKHQEEPTTCKGVDFTAFVILDCATTITKE